MIRVLFFVLASVTFLAIGADTRAETVKALHLAPGQMTTVNIQDLLPGASGKLKVTRAPSDIYISQTTDSITFHPLAVQNGWRRVIVQIGDDPINTARLEFAIGMPVENVSNEMYATIGAILFQLFVIAVFLEIALTLVFKSRFYINTLDDVVGGKTVISLIVSVIVVWAFGLNLFSNLITAITDTAVDGTVPRMVSFGVTALVIAGGSGSVYMLYTRLGVRPRPTAGQSGALVQGQGTMIVKLVRAQADPKADVQLMLGEDFIGTIRSSDHTLGGPKGIPVNAGAYVLTLKGSDAQGTPIEVKRNIGIETGKREEIDVTL